MHAAAHWHIMAAIQVCTLAGSERGSMLLRVSRTRSDEHQLQLTRHILSREYLSCATTSQIPGLPPPGGAGTPIPSPAPGRLGIGRRGLLSPSRFPAQSGMLKGKWESGTSGSDSESVVSPSLRTRLFGKNHLSYKQF